MAGVSDKAGDVLTRAKRRVGIENPSAADDEGNVGIVRGALRAFGEGETDKFLEVLHEDVTWEAPGGNFPGGSDLEGRDEVRDKYIDHAGRTFTQFGFVPESYLDADAENAVVVFGKFTGEGTQGGGLEVPAVMVWIMKGSEAEVVRIYTDGAAFPEVVTKEKEEKWEEERKQKEEEERKEKEEAESKGDDDSDDESDDGDSDDDDSGSEAKRESKSDSGSESKSEDRSDSESKSDSGSESKSDSGSDSESEGEDRSDSESDSDDSDDDDSEKSS